MPHFYKCELHQKLGMLFFSFIQLSIDYIHPYPPSHSLALYFWLYPPKLRPFFGLTFARQIVFILIFQSVFATSSNLFAFIATLKYAVFVLHSFLSNDKAELDSCRALTDKYLGFLYKNHGYLDNQYEIIFLGFLVI